MTQSKHTPGPWEVQDNTDQEFGQLRVDSYYDGPVAICGTNGETLKVGDECRANAKLMAASPDLLEALKIQVDLSEKRKDFGEFYLMAKAAIAKAEGR